jgi:four helix bundle protein
LGLDKHQRLKDRTKMFALRIIKMAEVLPKTPSANIIANQILRSSTSMAANYRAVGRARSKAEFIAKIGVVLEEADETVFWLEMLADSGIVSFEKLKSLAQEANELMLIFSASRRTAKS